MSYAQDRLYLALHALVGASPIRDRLISAAHAMLTLESKDFSNADEAQTFVKLWRDLTVRATEEFTVFGVEALSTANAMEIPHL
jgi:hypothetical protein